MTDAISRIERRLDQEKYMSDAQIDMVMAVIEQELLGETDREHADSVMHETGDVR